MTILDIPGNLAHSSGAMGTVDLVVIHATVSPCVSGGAQQVARYFQTFGAGGLAQYVVDPDFIVRSCPETVAGWHAPPVNHRAIGVELCDPQTGPASRWGDADHQMMLHRAAGLVADLCARHDLPVEYVDRAGLLAGGRGITTHAAVSTAWRQSSHTDPGTGWPLSDFLSLVRQAAGTPTPEDDVTPQDIEAVAQRVRALLLPDLRTVIHGGPDGKPDGQHPGNLDQIRADTSAIRKAVEK